MLGAAAVERMFIAMANWVASMDHFTLFHNMILKRYGFDLRLLFSFFSIIYGTLATKW